MANKTTVIKFFASNPFIIIFDIIAVLVSWYFNKSVLLAIFHYCIGPLYLLYGLLTGRFADGTLTEIFQYYF